MKRAATHFFKRQSENHALFLKLFNFYFDLRPPGQTPGQDRGAKTQPQGQLECANPQGDDQVVIYSYLLHGSDVTPSSNSRKVSCALFFSTQFENLNDFIPIQEI